MYSNEDLERLYFKYQTEALPHGQSLQSFCLNNKVLTTARNNSFHLGSDLGAQMAAIVSLVR